jgi:hypothetical protein
MQLIDQTTNDTTVEKKKLAEETEKVREQQFAFQKLNDLAEKELEKALPPLKVYSYIVYIPFFFG